MNFLAHLYLSGDDPDLLVGNFIGDFVKGRSTMSNFSPDIVKGIELHRSIDVFTDTHAVVMESKKRLRTKYRHYSGVIVDVFYDHFLAKNWKEYHPDPLVAYASKVYTTIQGYTSILPEDVNHMLPYMIKGNWLVNYADTEGINRALSGMSRRTTFTSRMEEATVDLIDSYEKFKNEFSLFFPELIHHCKTRIDELNHDLR